MGRSQEELVVTFSGEQVPRGKTLAVNNVQFHSTADGELSKWAAMATTWCMIAVTVGVLAQMTMKAWGW